MPTSLDKQIEAAVERACSPGPTAPFDIESYIQAFRPSAQQKAHDVLGLLDMETTFRDLSPVFVSIGGGDGEELHQLLTRSDAQHGILIELSGPLANLARKRTVPTGKTITVLQQSAQSGIAEAIDEAARIISSGQAQAIIVTCHAVIHELYDRGEEFDPVSFFATIFSCPNIPTWFTYREPGAPEKWPEQVLLSADCSPQSLLSLASLIASRHTALADLAPKPQVVGDGLRVHKVLAMEVLAKLFYLEDLPHEIEERSTSVDHLLLQNALWLAIGDDARADHRDSIRIASAPTQSFIDKWISHEVAVQALKSDNTSSPLSIVESQTRVVAWRQPPAPATAPAAAKAGMPCDLFLASTALDAKDVSLLQAILLSKGRAWIESPQRDIALALVREIIQEIPSETALVLWCEYLLAISNLFAGDMSGRDIFSSGETAADDVGLGVLFRAEQMEFARKARDADAALRIGNMLSPILLQLDLDSLNEQERYVYGTAAFLLSSLLREGGRYDSAWGFLDHAEAMLLPQVDSHMTELRHCFYARQICVAMTGVASFTAASTLTEDSHRFAEALIRLSYSHAAWYLNDIGRACRHAQDAAAQFSAVNAPIYADRAETVRSLMTLWKDLGDNVESPYETVPESVRATVKSFVTFDDPTGLRERIAQGRPTAVCGLLQFARQYNEQFHEEFTLTLPRTLVEGDDGTWMWGEVVTARSLEEAERLLRRQLAMPMERRVPLLAD